MTATAGKPVWLTDYADPQKLLEKQIEARCIKLYNSVGVWVVKFSQPHKASQTLGIPDLLCYYRRVDFGEVVKWYHEVKAYDKKPTKDQRAFHDTVRYYQETVIVGGLNTAIDHLCHMNIAEFEPQEGHW